MLIALLFILIFLSFVSTLLGVYLNNLKTSKFLTSENANSTHKIHIQYNPSPEVIIINEERRKNIISQPDRKILFIDEEEEDMEKTEERDFQNLSFEKVDVVKIKKNEQMKKKKKEEKLLFNSKDYDRLDKEDKEDKVVMNKINKKKKKFVDLNDLKDFQYYEKFPDKMENDEEGKYYTLDKLMDESSEVSNYKTDNSGYLVSLNSNNPNKKAKTYDIIKESMDLSIDDPKQKGDWNERFQKSVKMMREFTTNTPLRRRIRVWRDLINLSQDL
jgi:hypothetical protein